MVLSVNPYFFVVNVFAKGVELENALRHTRFQEERKRGGENPYFIAELQNHKKCQSNVVIQTNNSWTWTRKGQIGLQMAQSENCQSNNLFVNDEIEFWTKKTKRLILQVQSIVHKILRKMNQSLTIWLSDNKIIYFGGQENPGKWFNRMTTHLSDGPWLLLSWGFLRVDRFMFDLGLHAPTDEERKTKAMKFGAAWCFLEGFECNFSSLFQHSTFWWLHSGYSVSDAQRIGKTQKTRMLHHGASSRRWCL